MATCLLVLLLAHVVSGFTPVIYNPQATPECGQGNPLQDDQLMEALSKIHQELGPPGCNPPQTDLVRRFSTASHQLPQATTRYVFPMAH